MGKIHLLGTEISNKIAAGEVVERPASVIKELAENSIDAGAYMITVEIKDGGTTYMRVSDNGSGMSAEDAKICFLRHATSKIQTENDLDAIYTLGFRGEALSSIGAVAKVSLYTKRAEDETGVCVTCTGGEILSSEDAGTPDGTTIVVEDLFYNTPARLKFLKKDTTEAGYITDVVSRLIFAHPEISFRLIINGKEKLFSPGDNNLNNAVYTVYGKDYARNTLPVEYENSGMKISGVIGKGTASTSKRTHQSFFVNKRYIKSPLMIRALEEAYKNQIMIGKFPFAVLNVEINPEAVDINVHPTKLEAKFSNERELYNTVYYGVKNALYEIPNVPKIERAESTIFKKDVPKEQITFTEPKKEETVEVKTEYKEALAPEKEPIVPKEMTKRPETPLYNPYENPFLKETPKSEPVEDMKEKYADILAINDIPVKMESPKAEEVISEAPAVEEAVEEKVNVFADEYFEIVGQVFDTYIIAEKGDEMLIVDQHAAHERLKYEELKAEIEEKRMTPQMLIEPVVMTLSASEMEAFSENAELFNELGFETDIFGEDTIAVRAVPGSIELGETEDCMRELVEQAENLKKELILEKKQSIMYSVACKSAIKANMKLSEEEMKNLVRRVLRLENINTCPHGRPIIITMSKKELEKEFKRIV